MTTLVTVVTLTDDWIDYFIIQAEKTLLAENLEFIRIFVWMQTSCELHWKKESIEKKHSLRNYEYICVLFWNKKLLKSINFNCASLVLTFMVR